MERTVLLLRSRRQDQRAFPQRSAGARHRDRRQRFRRHGRAVRRRVRNPVARRLPKQWPKRVRAFCAAEPTSRDLRPTRSRAWGWKVSRFLRKAREETGLAIVTEVMSEEDVDLIAEYADIMQVGTRSMENYALLEALGRCGRPVLLKRGMTATLEELLRSAQVIADGGQSRKSFSASAAFALSKPRRATRSTSPPCRF